MKKYVDDIVTFGVTCAVFLVCLAGFIICAPEIYMDEIFHVRQTQLYCQWEFGDWDSKITTFPGLYLFATFLYVPVVRAFFSNGCEIISLRVMNALFAIGTLWIMTLIFENRMTRKQALAHASALWLYPPLFFFNYLFYTDSGSVFFMLLSYLLIQSTSRITKKFQRSLYVCLGGLSCAVAILFRQTNVVWCAFLLFSSILQRASTYFRKQKCENQNFESDWESYQDVANGSLSVSTVKSFVTFIRKNFQRLVFELWPLMIPIFAFLAFVFANGSIVLGDKEHHIPVFHFAQLMYFFAITALLHISFHISDPCNPIGPSNIKDFLQLAVRCASTPYTAAVSSVVIIFLFLGVYKYSYAHPFILSDNRHYTFYVWNRWFGKGWQYRCFLLPTYIYSTWIVLSRIRQIQSPLWIFAFVASAGLVLCPAELIEPRYFTIPVLIAHINSPRKSQSALKFLVTSFAVMNLAIVWVFLQRPFEWHDKSIARFML